MVEQGLTAQRIYQDLSSEHGYAGSYYSVRRFVQKLEARLDPPFRRMECGPAEEGQVDFGTARRCWAPTASGGERMSSASS